MGEKNNLALVAHAPVFIDDQFWGLAITFSDFDDFLEDIGLENSSQNKYIYQLSVKDAKTDGTTIFWQSAQQILLNPLEININVLNAPD